jgi:hypothetical protein
MNQIESSVAHQTADLAGCRQSQLFSGRVVNANPGFRGAMAKQGSMRCQ